MIGFKGILTSILLLYFINTTYAFKILVDEPDDREPKEEPLFFTNKVSLVKRLVPRGYKTPPFEYDKIQKTVFAPKFRVQKRPIHNGRVFIELYKLLFRPVKLHKRNPLDAILKLAKQNGGHFLRQTNAAGHGEVYDPAGSVKGRPDPVKVTDVKSSSEEFNFPHFSLYNTWTYDKPLFHDLCPPKQVLVGHTCMYNPHV